VVSSGGTRRGEKTGRRVRVEGHRGRRRPAAARLLGGGGEQRLMAPVHAVENAERHRERRQIGGG
jgi:hypothetical protein